MGIINPETGAIDNFLWTEAQEGIKLILEEVSTAQALINPDYAFIVYLNKYRPIIEDFTNNRAMVNVRIGPVASENATNFDATHKVTFYLDCYVRGENEDDPDNAGELVPTDEVAVQRLHYLVAMVYSGMTNLKNIYFKLSQGKIVPGEIGVVFNPIPSVENSAETYAPAQVTFTAKFPYECQDLTGLPAFESAFTNLGTWAARIFKD
jgi:hypothetical protein